MINFLGNFCNEIILINMEDRKIYRFIRDDIDGIFENIGF